MSKINEIDEGNKIAKKLFSVLLFALFPFLLIVCIYIYDSKSCILSYIALKTIDLPAIYSLKSPLFSKVMDVYVKTSPFIAVLLFLNTHKLLRLKNDKSPWYFLMILFLFTLFYSILFCVFLLIGTELTGSVKILKVMSRGDGSLTFFYVSLYSVVFMFTYLYLWFFIGTCKAFKERR